MFGAQSYGAPSRFIGEIPAGLTDRESQRPRASTRARVSSWDRGGTAASWEIQGGRGDTWTGDLPGRDEPSTRRGPGWTR